MVYFLTSLSTIADRNHHQGECGLGGLSKEAATSSSPSISADGRYVTFESDADLVATDSGDYYDIFVHDRDADENGTYDEPAPVGISTIRVSVAAGGNEANGE